MLCCIILYNTLFYYVIYRMLSWLRLEALPCKRTPALPENTKTFKSRYYKRTGTICTNAKNKPLTTIENYCEIECERGYEMTRNRGHTERPHPQKSYLINVMNLNCSEEAQFCVFGQFLHFI